MVAPEGFVLPPWYLLIPILVVLSGVAGLLWTLEPPVTDRTVLSFASWMLVGSILHVLHRFEAYPDAIATLFATPGVYLVTALVGGLVWVVGIFLHAGGLQPTTDRLLGLVGTILFSALVIALLMLSWGQETFEPFWPVVAVVGSGVITALAWLALSLWFTDVAATTSTTGALVVFGHALDGVSTAVGYDVLGAGEEVPISKLILDAGSALPTAEYVGSGWLFVLVKVVLALVVLGLFREFVEEDPSQARLVLAFVAAVGLGPGVHNVLLFLVA